jgi:ABC-2 type transport system ATP-binding protein
MLVEAKNLDKYFGKTHAVRDLSFSVEPGRVTGFLGPNGSGKSTTMRLMLDLDRGAGKTLYGGKTLTELSPVTKTVAAHLDAKFFHPKRTAFAHLKMLGAEAAIPAKRITEVLELVGLESVARKRPGGFSLGMGQRLGLAGAILAEPKVLFLDEPANGLDPQSIQWLRDFLRQYALKGNSVFVSSHLLSEMQLLADDVVVIAAGQLIAAESMQQFLTRAQGTNVVVRSTEINKLRDFIGNAGVTSTVDSLDTLLVPGVTTDFVGEIAFKNNIQLAELSLRAASLEDVFLELTDAGQEFRVGGEK